MFKIYDRDTIMNIDLNSFAPHQFKGIAMSKTEDMRKLIHDIRGGIRTFKYLGEKSLKSDPADNNKEKKKEMIKFYITQFETMLTLFESLVEKNSHEPQ